MSDRPVSHCVLIKSLKSSMATASKSHFKFSSVNIKSSPPLANKFRTWRSFPNSCLSSSAGFIDLTRPSKSPAVTFFLFSPFNNSLSDGNILKILNFRITARGTSKMQRCKVQNDSTPLGGAKRK